MADSEDLETKSLLLILFGFMGSKPRYMQKYHKIVDGMQNITIHTVYPMKNSHSIFKTQRLNTLAKETLEYTAQFIEKEIKANHTPFVVFYVFLTSMKPKLHFWFKKHSKEDVISYYIHSAG
eukprot:228816_1